MIAEGLVTLEAVEVIAYRANADVQSPEGT
jgi:hypothetical protein